MTVPTADRGLARYVRRTIYPFSAHYRAVLDATGVGRKVRGCSKRTFSPNLQSLQCQVHGAVKRMRVCVQCIRSGKVMRPQKRRPFQMPTTL